jgi:hypothetical protein
MKIKYLLLITCCVLFVHEKIEALKVLHLSLHKGCIKDFETVAENLKLDLTSFYILESKETRYLFDPHPSDWNSIYNMSHEKAERIWQANKDYFNQFDAIVTSDTAPLSRIFLQNNWKKPLIIWICNRFDYVDFGTYDGKYPDAEYYDLFRKAIFMPNVKVIGYVAYEHFYATQKGVYTGNTIIKPCGSIENSTRDGGKSYIPENINKEQTLFIPPRLEAHQVAHLLSQCDSLGISAYCGKYNGPQDLKDFKGVLHFPYAWSNLALFENIQLGLPHFVPTQRFLIELYQSPHRDLYRFFALNNLEYSEWYCPENKDVIIYFDSWQDLKNKVEAVDYTALKEKICAFGRKHKQEMIEKWKEALGQV